MDSMRAQGDACFHEGVKYMTKKSFFVKKPDYLSATNAFEQAAKFYRQAKALDRARECLVQAAEAQIKIDQFYMAGKDYEEAAALARDEKKYDEAVKLYELASDQYREGGDWQRGAEVLHRSAKLLATENSDRASELFNAAADYLEQDNKDYLVDEIYRNHLNTYLKSKKYLDCLPVLKRQAAVYDRMKQPHNVIKNHLCSVLIHLAVKDYVAADKYHDEALATTKGYPASQEARAAEKLLDAFENMNPDELEEAKNNGSFKFLDNEFGKLVRDLRIDGVRSDGPSKKPQLQAAPISRKEPANPGRSYTNTERESAFAKSGASGRVSAAAAAAAAASGAPSNEFAPGEDFLVGDGLSSGDENEILGVHDDLEGYDVAGGDHEGEDDLVDVGEPEVEDRQSAGRQNMNRMNELTNELRNMNVRIETNQNDDEVDLT